MKLKALLLALFTAGFAVSIAVAASPAAVERGKPTTGATTGGTTTGATTGSTSTGTTTSEREHGKGERGKGDHRKDEGKGHENAACGHARKLELQGTFVAAGAGGFAMTVRKGNHGAKGLAGKQVSILVDAKTRFHGKKHALADLVAGDRLMVQAEACKADAAAGQTAAMTLLARKVGVKGAKKDDDDKDETTTSTTGTTTGS